MYLEHRFEPRPPRHRPLQQTLCLQQSFEACAQSSPAAVRHRHRGRDGCGGDVTDCRRRPVDFGDNEGHFSKRVLEGSGSYVLGSFVADRPSQTVIVRGWALNAEGGEAWTLNAVVVYEP